MRKPAPSMSAPSASGDSVDIAAAPAMAPNAIARRRPWNRPGTNPSTAGVTRLAPRPMMRRPAQVNATMVGASAAHASPTAASTRPMRSVLRHPHDTPSMPPAIMKAPATSAYTVFATWMSPNEAPSWDDNCATAMFIAALSLVVPTCARISATRGAYEEDPLEADAAVRDWKRADMENPFSRDAGRCCESGSALYCRPHRETVRQRQLPELRQPCAAVRGRLPEQRNACTPDARYASGRVQ